MLIEYKLTRKGKTIVQDRINLPINDISEAGKAVKRYLNKNNPALARLNVVIIQKQAVNKVKAKVENLNTDRISTYVDCPIMGTVVPKENRKYEWEERTIDGRTIEMCYNPSAKLEKVRNPYLNHGKPIVNKPIK